MRELLTYSVEDKALPRPSLTSNIGTAALRYDSRTGPPYQALKARLAGVARAHLDPDWEPVTGPIEARLVFERQRLKTDPNRIWKVTKPDTENLVKGTIDAHTGIVFVDDCQVIALSVAELYGDCDRITVQFNLLDAETSAWAWEEYGIRIEPPW